MAISQGNQHLRVFVADALIDAAAGADWSDDAVLPLKNATFVTVETQAGTAAPVADKAYQVVYKYPNGNILRSQVIPAGPAPVAKASNPDVAKIQTLTVPATEAGKLNYVVRVALPAYGGTISQHDTIFIYGSYKATNADTVDAIAAALAASLEVAAKKLVVESFVTPISVTGATITLESVLQPSSINRFEGDPFNFYIELTGDYAADGVTTQEMVIGTGMGRQVVEHEEFFAGYNSDYINRERNWPANGNPELVADKANTYLSYNIVSEIAQGGASPVTQRQTTILYVKE